MTRCNGCGWPDCFPAGAALDRRLAVAAAQLHRHALCPLRTLMPRAVSVGLLLPVESPAVSGLRKLCFLSRYLRFQELIADLLRRPVPVRRVETLSIVAQFDVACNITHGLFASRIDCAIHELLLEGREERLGR